MGAHHLEHGAAGGVFAGRKDGTHRAIRLAATRVVDESEHRAAARALVVGAHDGEGRAMGLPRGADGAQARRGLGRVCGAVHPTSERGGEPVGHRVGLGAEDVRDGDGLGLRLHAAGEREHQIEESLLAFADTAGRRHEAD